MSDWFMAGAHAASILVGFCAVIAAVLLGLWLCLIAGIVLHDTYDRLTRSPRERP